MLKKKIQTEQISKPSLANKVSITKEVELNLPQNEEKDLRP